MSIEAQVLQLKMKTPIYPFYRKEVVKVDENHSKYILETLIRIEREGLYYLIRNKMEYIIENSTLNLNIEKVFQLFHKQVYEQYILYIVDVNLVDNEDNLINVTDTDQRSEEERLKQTLIF